MNDVKKNLIYNTAYQILILIIPLITLPYVSRILGAEGVGVYSYTYSIVNYFMLIALLGIEKYGNRCVAKLRDNQKQMSKEFWSIYIFQLTITLIVCIVYIIYLLFFVHQYRIIATIQFLYLLATALDINWLFFGLEKFKLTVTRNTIIKILSLFLIFIFVRTSNDLWKYVFILAGSTLLSNIMLFPFLRKYITFEKVTFKEVFKHFKPSFILFLPVIASSIYTIMDKIMIGSLSNMVELGFYENAEKIIKAPMAVITAFGTVMMPRVSNLISNKEEKKSIDLIETTMKFIAFLSFPIIFGIITVSKNFSIVFFGSDFAKSGLILAILSINIFFYGWGNVIRTQYLIPNERDKEYVISGILGAIINLILNYIFIPKYASIGACIGTLSAEFVVMFYQTYVVRKELPIKKYLRNIICFFLKALIMFLIVYGINFLEINIYIKLFSQVFVGGSVYVMLNYKYMVSFLKK